MIGSEYRAFVKQMSTKPDGEVMPLAVAALGLVGELGEVVDALDGDWVGYDTPADLLKELGDCFFYLTAVAESLGVSDAELERGSKLWFGASGLRGAIPTAYRAAAGLCEDTKKAEWHDQPARTITTVPDVYTVLTFLSGCSDYTLDEIKAANVAKLQARWPNGFGGAK